MTTIDNEMITLELVESIARDVAKDANRYMTALVDRCHRRDSPYSFCYSVEFRLSCHSEVALVGPRWDQRDIERTLGDEAIRLLSRVGSDWRPNGGDK